MEDLIYRRHKALKNTRAKVSLEKEQTYAAHFLQTYYSDFIYIHAYFANTYKKIFDNKDGI
jgi:hypothetical protein